MEYSHSLCHFGLTLLARYNLTADGMKVGMDFEAMLRQCTKMDITPGEWQRVLETKKECQDEVLAEW